MPWWIFQSTLLQEERPFFLFAKKYDFYFNPRSYKRSDCDRVSVHVVGCEFQSTLLQEERRGGGSLASPDEIISIHAPTRGATAIRKTLCPSLSFQSTLLQEERRISTSVNLRIEGFQSTLLQEERPVALLIYLHVPDNFNPRSYKRSDPQHRKNIHSSVYFNPRSYKRSDNVGLPKW